MNIEMNAEMLSILLWAIAGFIGIAVAYLVSQKPVASPEPASVPKKKSLAERIAEGLVGAKSLPVPAPVPRFAYAFRKNGKREMFRVVDMNRHRVFLDELSRTGGCVMSRPRSRVQFV